MKNLILCIVACMFFVTITVHAQETKTVTAVSKVQPAASQPAFVSPPITTAVPVATAKSVEPTAEPTVSEWWKVLIKHLMELVFTILGVMATVFVSVLMKKYGFENYSTKVNDLLLRGTAYAEQMSLKAAKVGGKPLAGAEKMELALGFIESMAKQYNLPDKGKDFWTKKVEGWLGTQH